MIRRLAECDLESIVQLHSSCLGGYLRELGPLAIRAFYEGALSSKESLALVFLEETNVVGFVFGAKNPVELKSDILKNHFFATLSATVYGLVRKPRLFRYLVSSARPGHGAYDASCPELTYIAVSEASRSGGVGARLVHEFGCMLKQAGIRAYELSVDADNRRAVDFYERLGFRVTARYQEFGSSYVRYRWEYS